MTNASLSHALSGAAHQGKATPQPLNEIWLVDSGYYAPTSGMTNASRAYVKRIADKLGYGVRIIDKAFLDQHKIPDFKSIAALADIIGRPSLIASDYLHPFDAQTFKDITLDLRPDLGNGNYVSMTHLTQADIDMWRDSMRVPWSKHPIIQIVVNQNTASGDAKTALAQADLIIEKIKDLPEATLFVTDTLRSSPNYYDTFKSRLKSGLDALPHAKQRFSFFAHHFNRYDTQHLNNPYIRDITSAHAIISLNESGSVLGDASFTGCPVYVLSNYPSVEKIQAGAKKCGDPHPERFRDLSTAPALTTESLAQIPPFDATEHFAEQFVQQFRAQQQQRSAPSR